MALALKGGIVLKKAEAEGCVLLYRSDPVHHPAPVFRVHPIHAMVLALFDGTRTFDELAEIVTAVLQRSPEQSRLLLDAVAKRYGQFLIEANGNGAQTTVNPAEVLFPTQRNFLTIREPAPAAILWVVTECCNRKCRYCYKDARFVADGAATDLAFPGERVAELIDEAAEIGVSSMILSGGEPFLRPDLIDLIGVMVDHGMNVCPLTKHRITGERMRALVRTGVQKLHVSLDSYRSETVGFLTGVSGAFDDMVATIRAAAEAGLPVVLRPVLTRFNIRDFEGLVRLGDGLGVSAILADLYGESCGRHDAGFEVPDEDYKWLREITAELSAHYPRIEFKFKFDRPSLKVDAVGRGCVEGARGMTVLPDGRVTKCEHWMSGDELTYGDLRIQSIMEVWQSERLSAINEAPRDAYAGTVCGRCKKFTECSERRGRCTVSALREHQSIYAPDVYCPIGAFQKRSGHDAHS